MKRLRLIGSILKNTGADKMMLSFISYMVLCALLIWLLESGNITFLDAIWFCFTVVSTIGFGDVVVHNTLSRVLSMTLSLYAVIALAIFTAVIVNYFTQLMELRQKNSLAAVIDKLERLPELSKEELEQLSEQIKRKTKLMS